MAIETSGARGAIVEVNCETDFVARSDDFRRAVSALAPIALATGGQLDALTTSPSPDGDGRVGDLVTRLSARTGERVALRRTEVCGAGRRGVARAQRRRCGDRLGVLVAPKGRWRSRRHRTAGARGQHSMVTPADIPNGTDRRAELRRRRRRAQTGGDRQKMVEGRLRKFIDEVVLRQPFIIDPDGGTGAGGHQLTGRPCAGFVRPRRRYDDGVTFFRFGAASSRRAAPTSTPWAAAVTLLLLLVAADPRWDKAPGWRVVHRRADRPRGYGDSSKPAGRGTHEDYSKRAMANDQVQVMRALGFDRFAVAGHDRGARVTWRLAVEHPGVVTRAAVLDIVPLPYSMLSNAFVTEYFHWYFLIQPAPLPDAHGRSAEFCAALLPRPRRRHARGAGGACAVRRRTRFTATARTTAPVRRSISNTRALMRPPGRMPASCCGGESTVGRLYDVMDVWRRHGRDVRGHALPGRHFIAEECPDATFDALRAFVSAA